MALEPDRYKHLAFLKDVDADALVAILSHMRLRKVPRRAVIFQQGEPSETACIVVSGQVRISVLTPGGSEMTLDTLGSGDLFGIAGLANGIPRVSNATATSASTLLEISTDALRRLLDRHPAIYRELLQQLLRRLTRSIQEHVATGTQRVYGRVAAKLLALSAANCGPGDAGDDQRRLPEGLSHQELASMIGSTRATVTRILHQMRREGIVDVDAVNRQMVIREVGRLAELSDLDLDRGSDCSTVFP